MRQESTFKTEAKSWADAQGLLQLIPKTAQRIAGEIGEVAPSTFVAPEVNIRLGTAYLSRLFGTFDGGPALVYRARDVRQGARAPVVVLKRLTEVAANDPDFVDRFLAEIDLCRRFDHPNVVRTLDFGSDGDSYFVVLGYIDGQNLEATL